jgi:hypothetical protein
MGVKEQFATMKENWLIVVLAVVLIIFMSGGSNVIQNSFDGALMSKGGYGGYEDAIYESDGLGVARTNYYPGVDSGDFAPDVDERKIAKTSSFSNEIERGEFREAEEKLRNVLTSSDAYLLTENVNRNGEGWKGYYHGYYSIKIEADKYDSVVAQLKEIGEVQSFNENALDITARYENLEIEIDVEKERLERYLEMYDEATEVEDKIDLNDRIFAQERTIKYLEDSLRNTGNRVEYSTISFTITEERSSWTGIALVGISDLFRTFMSSLNSLLQFAVGILPWGILVWIGWLVWKKVKK